MTKETAYLLRNRAADNAERLVLADQLSFWRSRLEETTDPLRLASYRRIVKDLQDIAARFEAANV